MNCFIKPSVALATLLLSFPALRAQTEDPKWYDTNDRFVVSGVNPDTEYGDYITVSIEGPDNHIYMAYNFDLILPAGVTFGSASLPDEAEWIIHNNDNGIYPTTRGNCKHTLAGAFKDNYTRARVACYSINNDEFLKVTGPIVNFNVIVHPLAKAGVNQVKLKGMVFNTKGDDGFPIQWAPFNTLYNYDWSTMTIPAERSVEVNISADAKWGTLILPFALSALSDGVTAYRAARVNGSNEVELETVDALEPYKPYVVNAPNGWTETLTGTASADDFPAATVAPAEVDDEYNAPYPVDAIASHGVLSANIKPHERSDGYLLTVGNDGVPAFARISADAPQTLATGDVFLTLPADFADEAPESLALKEAGGSSAITSVNADATAADAPVYNLQGERVSTLRPGNIYVSRGLKFRK